MNHHQMRYPSALMNKELKKYHYKNHEAPTPKKKHNNEHLLSYEVHMISFQTFFVLAFKIVVDSWKFTMLLLYIIWDDWPIFMISGSNQQLQQQLEYTLLKPDCHSWWISKMQSDTLEERYAIKFENKILGRGLEFHACTINKSAHTKKSLQTYHMHHLRQPRTIHRGIKQQKQ